MSLARSIAYNTVLQTFAKIAGTLLAVFAFGMITRYLGQEGFGAYTTITAYLQFFGIVVDMGLSVIALQLISEVGHDHKKNFANIFTMRVVVGIIVYGGAAICAWFLPYPDSVRWGILISAPSFFLSSLIQLSTATYQVGLKMMAPVIADVASKIVLIIGIIGAIKMDLGLIGVLVVIVINNLVQWLIIVIPSRAWHTPIFSFDWHIWRMVVERTWPIALSILCNIAYFRADTIVLSLFRPQSEVGIYGAAFKVIEVLITFPAMFMGLTLGSFAKSWSSRDTKSFARYFQKTFDFMALTSLPIIVGTFFVGTPIMILVAGQSFEQSGDVLKLLIVAGGVIFFSSLFGHLINIIYEQKTMLAGYFFAAIVGLFGYIVFIPRYSYWAAGWITILTEILVACIGFFVFYRKTRIAPSLGLTLRAVVASAIMGLFLYTWPDALLGIKIIGGGVAYIAALYLLGGLTRDMLNSLLPTRRG